MFPRNENRNEGTFAKTTLLETALLSPSDPFWCWQKGGFQKGGFGGCSPGMKTGTRVRSPKPPFYETALLSCGTIVPGTNPHPSQGQTGQNGDFTVELNRERPVCPRDGSHFVPRRGPICPRDGSCLSRTPSLRKCLCLLVFFLARAYRGQNPQNRERGFRSQKPPFSHHPRKGRSESKNPHFYTEHYKENGDLLTQNTLFWGGGKWGFLTPKPLFFPIFFGGFWDVYQGHGKGGLSLRGVAVMTETAKTAETATTVKTATVASFCCIL